MITYGDIEKTIFRAIPKGLYPHPILRGTEMTKKKTDYIKYFKKKTGFCWDSKKYEIHHLDMDRENNDISNLILIPKNIHKRFHALQSKLLTHQFDIFAPNRLDIFSFLSSEEIIEYFNIKEYFFLLKNVIWVMTSLNLDTDYFGLKNDYFNKMEKINDRKD